MFKLIRRLRAVRNFLVTWEHLLNSLHHDYDCTLTCAEAEALCELLRAHGRAEDAAWIMSLHESSDEEGDDHFQG